MTSLKLLRFLKYKLETPHVVSYFFNGLLDAPLKTQGIENCADDHTDKCSEQHSQKEKAHVTPPLAVRAGEEQLFQVISCPGHIQDLDPSSKVQQAAVFLKFNSLGLMPY